MKTRIRVEAQVEAFAKSLAPDPRRLLRMAIRSHADGRGDIKSLEGNLAGYCRLGLAGYRIIYKERAERGARIIDCLFAKRRPVVYQIVATLLAEQAGNPGKG